ncbi:MAG: rod shape-determining protein MreC [Clostridia bacterium]|nr:rod shape-determining protein MreC [Clostridia bacterium]
MRDFFKSRFFTVIVVITLIMVIVPSVFGVMGIGRYLRDGVNILLTPFQKLFTYVTDAADGFVSYFTEFDRIVEENEKLKEQNAQLRDKISAAEEAEQMNDWLFSYLELKREHTDYSFQDASVTGRESSNYMTVFTLDKGSSQGIAENMPVVTPDGIVGYVSEVGTDWCRAVTLLQSGGAAGAYVERSGEIGVVEGDYTLSRDGLCKMEYMAADADIKVGDRILSSGLGSVYPRGLVIGYVESVEPDAASRGLSVTVRPSADLTDISKLMIITKYDSYTE